MTEEQKRSRQGSSMPLGAGLSLRAQGLAYRYRFQQAPALRPLDLDLRGGRMVAILGSNGAGKSTLFRLLLGLLPLQEGQIWVQGQELSRLSLRQRAQYMAYIPQAERQALPFSAQEMVLMGRSAGLNYWERPSAEDERLAQEAMAELGIGHLAARNVQELSGGERQLVLIARAVCQASPILLMDEPCSSLDYGNQMRLLCQARQLARQGRLVLFSTHNPEHARIFADEALLFDRGELLAQGAVADCLQAELLSRMYHFPLSTCHIQETGEAIFVPVREEIERECPSASAPLEKRGRR